MILSMCGSTQSRSESDIEAFWGFGKDRNRIFLARGSKNMDQPLSFSTNLLIIKTFKLSQFDLNQVSMSISCRSDMMLR